MGIPVEAINKIQDGSPHVVDWIDRGDVDLVINTPTGTGARSDGYEIRRAAIASGIPCITTIAGGMAAARAIAAARVSARRRCSRWRSSTAPGRSGASRTLRATATLAPLGRGGWRRCASIGASAPTTSSSCDDPDGPDPDPGQFYMLAAAERWGGGEDERPFLPRAFSVARAPRAARGLNSCSRPSVRARPGWASCAPGDGLWIAGPFGVGFARRATAARRCWSAAASAPRRSRSGRTSRRRRRRCWASVMPTTPRARHSRATPASRPTTAASGTGPGHRSASRGVGPTRSRGLFLRAAGDAGSRARDLRRAGDPGPARARVRHGVRVRRLLRVRRPDHGRLRAAVRRRAGPGRRRRSRGSAHPDRRSWTSTTR